MRSILCFGDSNTWGQAPMRSIDDVRRLGPTERWTGVLAQDLGAEWTVIEEGLPGRTTVFDDPIEGPHLNGKTHLRPCLDSHWPLDVIAIMLGTNDLKPRFAPNAVEIAFGVGTLLHAIKTMVPSWAIVPKIVVICPAPVITSGWPASLFKDARAVALQMPDLYAWQANRFGADFLDAGTIVNVSEVDGVHLDADQHRKLGMTISSRVKKLVA